MTLINSKTLNFAKLGGLVPVCIQDHESLQVLMIGFMNEAALQLTLETCRVTFYSRTKNRLWTKGETSGHFLQVVSMALDCDNDSILCLVKPEGPTCHQGTQSCFQLTAALPSLWYGLSCLNRTIYSRQTINEDSYTKQLLNQGIVRIAQKVGEEGVEVALAAAAGTIAQTVEEVVDLLYHVLVLLMAKDIPLSSIAAIVQKRSQV